MAPWDARLQRKCLAEARRLDLTHDPLLEQMLRRWQADVDLFREVNVPLGAREAQLAAEYDTRCGSMSAEFDGKPRTIDQLAAYLSDTNRETRKAAWEAMTRTRLQHREAFDTLFDSLVGVRHQMAVNADHPDYRSYVWMMKRRFDYTPQTCLTFGETVERLVVPLVDEWNAERARALGVDVLRPWDLRASLPGTTPLRPFAGDDAAALVDGTARIFRRLSPELAAYFERLREGDSLDLVSRPGKQPGGYMSWLAESRRPFIFMNAAGTQRDVEVLLHESGHAFHCMETDAHVPLLFARYPGSEFAEVASMSMELLGTGALDEFYSPDDARRAKRHTFETAIRLLPRVARVDAFQQWVYTHPHHTREERTAFWRSLQDRFGGTSVDWTGYDDVLDADWQWVLHVFAFPFYFIEYGFAQLGALQLWLHFMDDAPATIARYREALALGGTRSVPGLWAAAGLSFDFSGDRVERLVQMVRREVADLPL